MSSDQSVVSIVSMDGSTAVLRVRTADQSCGYDFTRSFALNLLVEALTRARDFGFTRPPGKTPLELEAERLEQVDEYWFDSEEFMEEHLDEYVERTDLIERHNVHDETTSEVDGLIRYRDDVASLGLSPKEAEDKLCEQYHHVVLRVRVADPKWFKGLRPGLVFASASYDVWLDDPKSGDE